MSDQNRGGSKNKQSQDSNNLFDSFTVTNGEPFRVHNLPTLHDTASLELKPPVLPEGIPDILDTYQKTLDLAERHLLTGRHQLSSLIPHSLPLEAAAHAIGVAKVERAIELLEQGRTLLWTQMGRYLTALDTLQDVHPGLASEFTQISEMLEASATSFADEFSEGSNILANWDAKVDQIRQLDGFSNFLQAPRFSNLKLAAKNGPVVVINISELRSDAIIVQMSGDPLVVPLPKAKPGRIKKISSNFATGVEKADEGKKDGTDMITSVLESLWDDILSPVISKLQEIGVPQRSRIWLCPTASLVMLPLHAAGKGQHLGDIYITSYTPTLSALIKSLGSPTSPHSLLAVAQPNAAGEVEIPAVKKEVEVIRGIDKSAQILLGEDAVLDKVLIGLKNHSWVHLACHGEQNLLFPFKSGFLLLSERLSLVDIVQARLPNAKFVFLSACHTAADDPDLPDERIHLAAALQFSGFQSVIGTMYAMSDADGPVVAEIVYKHLFRRSENKDRGSGELADHRDAAEGLNIATKTLRDKGVPLHRWINFVHIGA